MRHFPSFFFVGFLTGIIWEEALFMVLVMLMSLVAITPTSYFLPYMTWLR